MSSDQQTLLVVSAILLNGVMRGNVHGATNRITWSLDEIKRAVERRGERRV